MICGRKTTDGSMFEEMQFKEREHLLTGKMQGNMF